MYHIIGVDNLKGSQDVSEEFFEWVSHDFTKIIGDKTFSCVGSAIFGCQKILMF